VTAKLIEIIIMEGIAVLMVILAYLIGVKRKMYLIAGYNERTAVYVHDKPGLARLVGRLCLLVGIASAFMPVATALWGARPTGWAVVIGGYGGFIAGVVAMTMFQARDFTRSDLTSKKDRNVGP
jgi:hypothetical protein